MKAEKPFATEAALCAAFLDGIKAEPWVAYPESCGWDILLSRKSDGFQIGIQAKLKFNTHVVSQALEYRWSDSPGPDCRAVLVPHEERNKLREICAYIGLTVIEVFQSEERRRYGRNRDYEPRLPDEANAHDFDAWFELLPTKRHELPEYVPDAIAGSSAPVQLTRWKIKAIKVAIILERRGAVTRQDFNELHLDHRRWINADTKWLRIEDGRLLAGPGLPDFKAQHPRNYAEIAADFDKWAPRVLLPTGAGAKA